MRGRVDDSGFEEAFDGLFVRAFRTARRIVGDADTAEDVAAEALARTYARWGAVRDLPHLDAWVLRVAANVAIDVVRRRRRSEAIISVGAEVVGADGDVEMGPDVAELVASLPARQREVVLLRHVAGLAEHEVADVLGISVGSVKTHNARALRALRRHVAGDDSGEVRLGLV